MVPSPPPSSDKSGSFERTPRAFVRQCEFFERYGGCKFGKDCFYAHNNEMTLGVRNAMQMAQQLGRGGAGGGIEIRFDERENEVKMVRVIETFPAGGGEQPRNGRSGGDRRVFDRSDRGFGRDGPGFGPRGGGGRGRFGFRGGRGGGGFRGPPPPMRGDRGRRTDDRRFISPVRGSGNIFAEGSEANRKRMRGGQHHSRSLTPGARHHKRSKRSRSSSGGEGSRGKKRGRRSPSSTSSSSSRSRSRSAPVAASRCQSNSPLASIAQSNKKRTTRRRSSSPDASRMQLRSLAKKLEANKATGGEEGQKKEEEKECGKKKHQCHHRQRHAERHKHLCHRRREGQEESSSKKGMIFKKEGAEEENGKNNGSAKAANNERKSRRRSRSKSSSSSCTSDVASRSRSAAGSRLSAIQKKMVEEDKNGTVEEVSCEKSRWEEEQDGKGGADEREYSPGAISLIGEHEREELNFEEAAEEEGQEEEEEERQRKELLNSSLERKQQRSVHISKKLGQQAINIMIVREKAT